MTQESTAGFGAFLDGMQATVERVMGPFATFVGNQRHINAIKDAMTAIIPFTVIGGIAIMLACPPISEQMMAGGNIFYDFMVAWNNWAGANGNLLWLPFNLTLGCISLYAAFGVAYNLAQSYSKNGLVYGLVGLLVFFIASGAHDGSGLTAGALGSSNVFGAVITSIIVVEVMRFFEEKNIAIRLPETVPPAIAAPFNSLISSAVLIFGFLILNDMVTSATGASITQLIYTVLTPILIITDSIPGVLILVFLVQFFWFLGIHASVVLSIAQPIMLANIAANAEAYAAGKPLQFLFADGIQGAFAICIANLAIVTLMCVACKSSQIKSVGRLAIMPLVFEITEPFVFGTPVIMNPYLFFPFCVVPVINSLVYCVLATMGIMGKMYLELPWTTPAPIWCWLSTGRISGLVFFCVMFAVDIVLCLPFLRSYDKKMLAEEQGE